MLIKLVTVEYGRPGQLPAGLSGKQEKPKLIPPKVSGTQRSVAAQ